jgi:hypothetical protein
MSNKTRETSRLVSDNNIFVDNNNNIGIGTTVANTKLQVAGNVTAIDYNSTSDIRMKKNVKQIENALQVANLLRGVSFEWKENSSPSMGIIAQELEEILPELVSGDSTKVVNYNGIIAVLIEAIKELKIEVDKLKIINQ